MKKILLTRTHNVIHESDEEKAKHTHTRIYNDAHASVHFRFEKRIEQRNNTTWTH